MLGARELVANLVRRDLKVRHRGTFLGSLWSLTNPALIVGLYYFIFKVVFRTSPAPDFPRPDGEAVPFAIYFFSGLIIWNLFSASVGSSTGSIIGAGYLVNKVRFPRAVLPLSAVLSSLVTFAFELGVLAVIILFVFGIPTLHILWVPLIVGLVAVLAYGLALFLSAATVFLRDLTHFIGICLQLWFWGSPIIYSLQFVSDRPGIRQLIELNPMTGLLVSFRNVVVLDRAPRFDMLGYSALWAVAALVVGALCFKRWQRLFSEIV